MTGLYFPPLSLVALVTAIILVLSFFVLTMSKCDVDGPLMYGLFIPPSAIFRDGRLGEFGPQDVVSAEIVRTRMQGYGTYTSLYVRSRFGDIAGFGGGPDLSPEEFEEMTDQAMREFVAGELERQRGDMAVGLEWLRSHGITVGLSTPRGERLRARRQAKWILVGSVLISGGVAALFRALDAGGIIAPNEVLAGYLMSVFALFVGAFTGLSVMEAGVAVSGETIYRARIPLSSFWRPSRLGERTAADVRSWRIRRPGPLERRSADRVLEVRFGRGGKGIVYDPSDREAFIAVERWLEERCEAMRFP